MATGPGWQTMVGRATRVAQIAVSAMAAGALTFLVVALWARWGRPPAAGHPILTWIAVALAVAMTVVRLTVPPMMVAHRRAAIARGQFRLQPGQQSPQFRQFLEKTGDAGLLWLVYISKLFVAGVPLETAAFVAVAAYLVEGNPWALGAAVVLIASLAMMIPQRETVVAWIEDQLRLVEQERQLPG